MLLDYAILDEKITFPRLIVPAIYRYGRVSRQLAIDAGHAYACHEHFATISFVYDFAAYA